MTDHHITCVPARTGSLHNRWLARSPLTASTQPRPGVAHGDMPPLAATSGIEYERFTESDSLELMRLLGEAFAKHDLPAVAVGLTAAEFQEFVGLLCANADTQGLTTIARSVINGEMAGALHAEDSRSQLPAALECLSAKFKPIFDILGQLESAYRGDQISTEGESVHLFLLGVAERFRGRGIGEQLVARCMANAAGKGYRLAVREATNRT